jgi:hypothetical protein
MSRRTALVAAMTLVVVAMAVPVRADSGAKVKADFVVTDYPGIAWEDQHITVKTDESGKGKLTWDNPFKDWDTLDPADLDLPPDVDLKDYGKEIWISADIACAFFEGNVGTVAAQVTRTGTTGYGFPEAWVGAWLVVELHDEGPNGEGDYLLSGMVLEAEALAFCATGDLGDISLSYNDLIAGDIAIRS